MCPPATLNMSKGLCPRTKARVRETALRPGRGRGSRAVPVEALIGSHGRAGLGRMSVAAREAAATWEETLRKPGAGTLGPGSPLAAFEHHGQ
jgi:hypothetical protein